ncbi:hypothetical protein G4X40_18500 [Rhodococcus sp. D2-41]|uniref:hypothetical protein n=1 Tax=Speluncibacter jeojiensis TaxID=2710754 RepID=UPI00241076D8|nr:hypothetical protein [Rhodococcus sp. D2-41]MDG3012136.1 hypothetical protein [Rhodococcus sp. D2-41]
MTSSAGSVDSAQDWLAAIGAGPIFLAIIAWWLAHRKTRADTAKVFTDIAQNMVETQQKQLDRLGKELADHKKADREDKARRAVIFRSHAQWDHDVAKRLRDSGIDVPDPPPLHEE